MTSKLSNNQEAFVWIWLPRQIEPTCAGKIKLVNDRYLYKYSKDYLNRTDSIALSPFELPLLNKTFRPEGLNTIHSCLRDAAPDAWGRRVINYEFNFLETSELDYMLLSGSNRIGALDFQHSAIDYTPRNNNHIELQELMHAAECIENNLSFPKELQIALLHGTSIGGARPKAIINNAEDQTQYIAKFASSTDTYNHIKAEYLCMRLAKLSGIDVANVSLQTVLKKDILLIERFDRIRDIHGTCRKIMLSGLSLLGLNELEARYASYPDLAEIIRHRFTNPKDKLTELYKRLVFNVLIGNIDDHARKHSAFWDGKYLTLTPAYDLCPQPRVGYEASQAMAINGKHGNQSKLSNVLSICQAFQLQSSDAQIINESIIKSIESNWDLVCAEAKLSKLEQASLWGKSIFNPLCFQD